MSTVVRLRRGTEGPRYDPYGWQEIEVEREGKFATLRSSGLLNDWLEVGGFNKDGRVWTVRFEGREAQRYFDQRWPEPKIGRWGQGYQLLEWIFEKHIGYAPDVLVRWQIMAEDRRPEDPMGSLGDYE